MAKKAKSTKKKSTRTSEDLWAREWQIQLGYDNDPYGQPGGGGVLRDPNKENIFKLERTTTSGLKAKAYRAIPVNNSTTDYWKDAVFFEMGSKRLSLPTVRGLTKPYSMYIASQPDPQSEAKRNHINLLNACLEKVEQSTLRLVAGIPVSKPNNNPPTVVEHIFLYCIEHALHRKRAKKNKHLLLIDLQDTSMLAGGPNQSGAGGGHSTRP